MNHMAEPPATAGNDPAGTSTVAGDSDAVLPADPRLESSLPWIIRNGIGIQIMETLAVGAILTAFAIQLGASNFIIGLLAAIPHLSQLAQIPAMHTVDRVASRRAVYTWSGYVAHTSKMLSPRENRRSRPSIRTTAVPGSSSAGSSSAP